MLVHQSIKINLQLINILNASTSANQNQLTNILNASTSANQNQLTTNKHSEC